VLTPNRIESYLLVILVLVLSVVLAPASTGAGTFPNSKISGIRARKSNQDYAMGGLDPV
jgi:hypothetical protein